MSTAVISLRSARRRWRLSPRVPLFLIWLTLTLTACASILNVGLLPTITVVPQRTSLDCMVAALAMGAGRSYEDVYHAAENAGVEFADGFTLDETMTTAKRLGMRLQLDSRFNPVMDAGIIVGRRKDVPLGSYNHAVYLYRQVIYDGRAPHIMPWVLDQARFESIAYFLRDLNRS